SVALGKDPQKAGTIVSGGLQDNGTSILRPGDTVMGSHFGGDLSRGAALVAFAPSHGTGNRHRLILAVPPQPEFRRGRTSHASCDEERDRPVRRDRLLGAI
ncbi:hypothetical protein, partial [Micromonospora sicca]